MVRFSNGRPPEIRKQPTRNNSAAQRLDAQHGSELFPIEERSTLTRVGRARFADDVIELNYSMARNRHAVCPHYASGASSRLNPDPASDRRGVRDLAPLIETYDCWRRITLC